MRPIPAFVPGASRRGIPQRAFPCMRAGFGTGSIIEIRARVWIIVAYERGGWADRYRQGDRERVWAELGRFGSNVRDPNVLTEAQAVCDEMALRARFNIELLVNRLQSQA